MLTFNWLTTDCKLLTMIECISLKSFLLVNQNEPLCNLISHCSDQLIIVTALTD